MQLERAQPDCVAIGPFGLAGAEHAVKQAVEKRNMPVALDRTKAAVRVEHFDRIASVVNRRAMPGKDLGTGEGSDKRRQMTIPG